MKKLLLIAVAILFSAPAMAQETAETTTYYLIRHAEKDRSNPNERNPMLTQEGLSRAMQWAQVLKSEKIDAVYSTNYNRTKQTAEPTAVMHDVSIKMYDPRNVDIAKFKEETKGKTVLIVGHSNTTPFFANGLIGKKAYKQIDDSNNGNLYVVTIANGNITHKLLHFN